MMISRVKIGGAFELTDHHGQPVSDRTYRRRHMMIFFGFTHCRKVCPETLGKMSDVLDRLGSRAEAFAPIYITVDPDRDDASRMKTFLEANFPRFTGLTGSKDQIDAVRSAYKVFAHRAPDEEDPQGYAVPHSALVYITDRAGQYLTHFNDGTPVEKIVDRLNRILEGDAPKEDRSG